MKTSVITLPGNVLSAVDTNASPSPLGCYLAGLLTNVGGYNETTPPRHVTQGLMQGALALACQFPFSPDEMIKVGNSNKMFSLVQAVLHLSWYNHPDDPVRNWPTTIEMFGSGISSDKDGKSMGVDGEWLAAALVVAGCNPWKRSQEVPIEAHQAIDLGMTGLVKTLFSIEGAQHPDRVLIDSENNRSLQLGRLVSDPTRKDMLDLLTGNGIGHWRIDEYILNELVCARPEGIAVLVKNGLDLSDPKIKARLSSGWFGRVKNHELEPEACARMQETAFGKTAQDMDESSLMVAKVLAVEWGSQVNGSSSKAYDFMTNTGQEVLCGKGQLKRGQMAGQWSVLAAAVMSRIRQANSNAWQINSGAHGCLGWSAQKMILSRYSEDQSWASIDLDDPASRGVLSSAIGFEWSKGISIDGIMALGLWGQEDNKEADQHTRIDDFALLAGIDDLEHWSKQSAAHAAAFTCSIIKSNQVTVASAMMSTWARALEQCPAMVEGIDEQARVDLMHSLSCMFNLAQQWNSGGGSGLKVFQKVAESLFDNLQKSELTEGEMDAGPRREAALIMTLVDMVDSRWSVEQRAKVVGHIRLQLGKPEDQGGATQREKDILSSWAKSHAKESPMRAEADMVAMEVQTAQAQPANGRRGPRF